MNRRFFLRGMAGSALLLAGCPRNGRSQTPDDATPPASPAPSAPPPVPASAAVCEPTADNIEGPFFEPGAPERAVLATPDTAGQPLSVSGTVTGPGCKPIAGARMEIWHADHEGAYDNDGFDFRGVLETDAEGRYDLRTIVPGHYLNGRRYRPAHIHVKLAASGFEPLTTQLYFEGDRWNEGDPFIHDSLIMKLEKKDGVILARFDFALPAA